MAFVLKLRQIDIRTGNDSRIVVLRGHDAASFGINPGDRLKISYRNKTHIVVADITHHSIQHGEIGLFDEVWKLLKPTDGDPLTIEVVSRPPSVAAIKKKLRGEEITREEMHSIIQDIVKRQLGTIETTYFVASGYVKPYSIRELVWMVEAMAQTGETFQWKTKYVLDKHSVGGLAGNRTTMVAIPIIAALGFTIPKTSSRAITSPAGTADTMEVLAPVSFTGTEVRKIVEKNKACLIWGGGLSIAPADDIIIRVSRPLSLEPYDKMIVSILAKKVAMGVKFLIIDMPYGPGTKIPNLQEAKRLEEKFMAVGKAFGIRTQVRFDEAHEPIGQGIGPMLEARDVLRVLQQKPTRPIDLETKALELVAELVALTGKWTRTQALIRGREALSSGRAWKVMQGIIRAQGGKASIDANDLATGAQTKRVLARKSGTVKQIDNRALDEIARTLGAPEEKLAGIYLHKKIGDRVGLNDKLFTLYSYSADRLQLALGALPKHPLVTIA